MWELDHKKDWVPKNWCFQTVVLEKTLGSPLDCKEIKLVNPKGNHPWILIGRTELKLQYYGHLTQRADSLEKTLMLGKTEGKRSEQQRMKLFDSITDSMNMNLSKLWKVVKDREAWIVAVHGVTHSDIDLATEQKQQFCLTCIWSLLLQNMFSTVIYRKCWEKYQ